MDMEKKHSVYSRFVKGQKVSVIKNGKVFLQGTISDVYQNLCTYDWQYDVDYYNADKECDMTLIGVPEESIELI